MSAVRNYWTFNRLNSQGKIKIEEIAQAKSFIKQQCSTKANQIPFSDSMMQRHLFALLAQKESTVGLIAQICLRCFISEQIKQVCINLERQFGQNYQFNRYDLFPFVLDDTLDDLKHKGATEYKSMATKILQTFDPKLASLSTWTTRLVRYEQNLNRFLKECGLDLISDWAILNDTDPKQQERIFKEFHHQNDAAIAQASLLLKAYHTIYRQKRLENRKAGIKGKCVTPSSEQLQQIAMFLGLSLTPEQTLTQLQDLAEQLRQYRIAVRRGKLKQESFDHSDILLQVEYQQVTENYEDLDSLAQEEFLNRYLQQFLTCLEQAIAFVVPQWLNLQKVPKKQQFLTALKLFHCQGYSMTDIALAIGLEKQYQVTRLMQLKNFRADIRQHMLQNLPHQIIELAAIYTNPELLQKQEKQIELALEEQVTTMIEEAAAEASMAKNRPVKSIFACSLCRYLNH
ncbi:hypothetical protein C7H19_16460 [Aphanothece hegewaldii CCALA 016]|uniref:Uncharacterized protein n=1 Tax=Aphanothece hegewaldii CCALA 016 TaxID=2107694 RepID=A0A2T1LVF4_9CHRO|nr:hypothetical protein [Aphanothece hegewaldii]PSF35596.1 hypothetical protein C7H19_16460 [Aphanothece hegewaldii CCALA 016]